MHKLKYTQKRVGKTKQNLFFLMSYSILDDLIVINCTVPNQLYTWFDASHNLIIILNVIIKNILFFDRL